VNALQDLNDSPNVSSGVLMNAQQYLKKIFFFIKKGGS